MSNSMKFHYKILKSENITMKVNLYLVQLQDSNKFSDYMGAVNKDIHSRN